MKKFIFPLDTVLNYKDQILDSLKGEHARLTAQVVHQEQKIEGISAERIGACAKLKEEVKRGIPASVVRQYGGYIMAKQRQLATERSTLMGLKNQEEIKRSEVIEARKEKMSIEKLKEKKQLQYHLDLLKSEEVWMEEFVSNTTSVRNNG